MKKEVRNGLNEEFSLSLAGSLLFSSGFLIFMGIISSEIFYTIPFSTRDSYISELAAVTPPKVLPELSAFIFNSTLIITGIMILISAILINSVFKKLLASIPLILVGLGISGVGIFPGNIVPWHGISALIVFVLGGVGAITSYKIVDPPFRHIFIVLGVIILIFIFGNKLFIPSLGVGGTERWIFYPIVFWLTGLGGYLLGLKNRKIPVR